MRKQLGHFDMKQAANKKVKKRKSYKGLILLVVVIILVAGGLIWKLNKKQPDHSAVITPASSINYSPAKPSDNAANNARKGSTSAAATLDNGSSSSSVPFSVTVTRAEVFSSYLEVGTLVNGATSGTCTLSVSQSGQATITRSEAMQAQNNAYSCPVFQVPVSDFPDQDAWNVSVSVTSNGQTESNSWAGNPVFLRG